MNDDELEQRLRRYEPASPPASLRARALGARPAARRGWPWATAAAALLAAIVWLHGATDRVLALPGMASPQPASEEALLTDMLGGGEDARAIAQAIVALDDQAQRIAQAVGTAGTSGERR